MIKLICNIDESGRCEFAFAEPLPQTPISPKTQKVLVMSLAKWLDTFRRDYLIREKVFGPESSKEEKD